MSTSRCDEASAVPSPASAASGAASAAAREDKAAAREHEAAARGDETAAREREAAAREREAAAREDEAAAAVAARAGRRALACARPLEVQVRGLFLRGLAFGPGDGRRVLAVHGWLDNAHSFAPLAAALPDCHLVALEVPGHGHSQHRSPDAEYHVIDYVRDVAGAQQAIGWPTATLLGHSMGACVAALVAATLPATVEHLIMLDGIGPLSTPPEALPTLLGKHIAEQARLARRAPRVYASVEELAAQLARVVPRLPPAAAQLLAERASWPGPQSGVVVRADPRLRGTHGPRLSEAQVLAFLRAIAAPSLLLRASEGFPLEPTQLAGRVAAPRDLTVREVAGGHHVHMVHPRRVAAHLGAFWAARRVEAPCA